jgi:hypothetical protein
MNIGIIGAGNIGARRGQARKPLAEIVHEERYG